MSGPSSDKSFIIFGRDVAKLPCFRNSFLYGISGGIACGLTHFMFTSRPKTATDFAVGTFAIITLGYWFRCRYQYSKTKFEMEQVRHLLQQRSIYEGTEVERRKENDSVKNVSVDV